MTPQEQKLTALCWYAEQWLGVVDDQQSGGRIVDAMRKVVDGVAADEAWCVGFVQFCLRETDDLFDRLAPGLPHHSLMMTEWTIGLWENTAKVARLAAPRPGCVVVWAKQQADGSVGPSGHCGIVISVDGGNITTIEGNTSAPANVTGDQRNGGGVWKKTRTAGNIPGFTRLGYLLPYL